MLEVKIKDLSALKSGIFPAHIKYDDDTAIIETVEEHNQNVADMASEFASDFGGEHDARLAGKLHDIGKCTSDFVTHITHPELSMKVDHSTLGAQMTKDNLPVSFAIAGHHTGIPDGGCRFDPSESATLRGRLKREHLEWEALKKIIHVESGENPDFLLDESMNVWAFYTRMLTSCLVDADYLKTEEVMRPEVERLPEYHLEELLEKLENYTKKFYPPKGILNKIRCNVLDTCREMAASEPGLFTLSVPTGGGKTLSSATFALQHAVQLHKKRIIYVVPYTAITDQIANEFNVIFGKENVLEHHCGIMHDSEKLKLATENWDAPIILTTAVQFYESLYSNRSAKLRKIHNIANSVVIFDEAQNTPTNYLKPCVFAVAELIRHYKVSAVLCTATQPHLDDYFLEYGIKATDIYPDKEIFTKLQRNTVQNLGKLSTEKILKRLLKRHRVLCVVNRRATALEFAKAIPNAFCLTTLQTPCDRREILEDVRYRLANRKWCVVIATSLIEAGVDIDFPNAFREKAGLDSIIQTAGRCNRERKRRVKNSSVSVFELTDQYPMTMITQNIAATDRVEKKFEDVTSPEAIQEYFDFLRELKGDDDLDRKGILRAFEKGICGCMFPFAKVSEIFKLIESETHTVYIPNEENKWLLEKLRRGTVSRFDMRKLGQYGVSVYPHQLDKIITEVELLESGDAILINTDLYDSRYGLQI